MARRKTTKLQPAVTRLWFHIDPNNASNYVDLSLACSAANRRFYRQGLRWAVAGMSLHTGSNTTGEFDVSKVPDSWVAQNAFEKSKMLWMKSQDQVLDDQPSIAARYRDFKVSLDAEMTVALKQSVSTSPANDGEIMLPVDRNNQVAKVGEWIYSSIIFPDAGGSAPADARTLHFVGGDNGTVSKGMIHGYGLSRARPQDIDPNTPSDGGWMNEVFDVAETHTEIRLDVEEENNVPPYRVGADGDPEQYPGGANNQTDAALHSVGYVTGTTVGGKTNIEGGMFNCGLIRFDWILNPATVPADPVTGLPAPDTSMYLAIDLVPGTHKGYMAEAY